MLIRFIVLLISALLHVVFWVATSWFYIVRNASTGSIVEAFREGTNEAREAISVE
jgi:hypothetical protein